MNMIRWTATPVVGGVLHSNDIAEEYEILEMSGGKFFVRRTIEDCNDIGPYPTFKEAEDVVLQIGGQMVQMEELLWRTYEGKFRKAQEAA